MLKKVLSVILLTMTVGIFAGCTNDTTTEEPGEGVETPSEESGEEVETPSEEPGEGTMDTAYDNGTYRGVFEDSGAQQISVQFKLTDGNFSDIRFRHLSYDDVVYTDLEESDPLYGITAQHLQLAEYFEGKSVDSLTELTEPGAFIDDVDVATGATLRGNKVLSAMRDGLNRGLYAVDGDEYTIELPEYQDGTYRGLYGDSGDQQVSVQFKVTGGNISDVTFRHLYYNGTDYRALEESDPLYGIYAQHEQLAEYLEGKSMNSIAELHNPGEFIDDVDVATGATLRGNKVYSAIRDGLNRGIYSPANGYDAVLPEIEDGRYRGTYGDSGVQQVAIQFSVTDGVISDLSFRHLYYSDTDYRSLEESDALYGINQQYAQVLEYLDGQPIEAIYDLHNPGEFVEDVDAATGATLRANKVFSAIMNGLSKGVY